MQTEQIKQREKQMRHENAVSMFSKLLSGTIVILAVGIFAYALLFLLMIIF